MMHPIRELYSDATSTQNSLHSNSSNLAQLSPPPASTPIHSKTPLSSTAAEFVPFGTGNYINPIFGQTANEIKTSNNLSNVGTCPSLFNMNVSSNMLQQYNQHQILLRRQQILAEKQHLLQKQQQEYATAAAIAKQQYLLSTATASNHPQDEIANSLKMFALSSAGKVNDTQTQSPVDEIMKDFAKNGYSPDDFNRYRQYPAVSNTSALPNANAFLTSNNFNGGHNGLDLNINPLNVGNMTNFNLIHQQQLLYESINSTYNELWRQNFFPILPGQILRQVEASRAAAVAINAASINMDCNSQNPRPLKKAYKKDVQATPRRCVFCENNKEPEPVVKSHAVRDSQGRVLCPKLRIYICPICKASGDDAHTVKYCPQKPIITMEDATKAESNRHMKGAYIQKHSQMKV